MQPVQLVRLVLLAQLAQLAPRVLVAVTVRLVRLVRTVRMALLVLRHRLGSQRAVCVDQMEQHCVLLVCRGLAAEQLFMLIPLMRSLGMTI